MSTHAEIEGLRAIVKAKRESGFITDEQKIKFNLADAHLRQAWDLLSQNSYDLIEHNIRSAKMLAGIP